MLCYVAASQLACFDDMDVVGTMDQPITLSLHRHSLACWTVHKHVTCP